MYIRIDEKEAETFAKAFVQGIDVQEVVFTRNTIKLRIRYMLASLNVVLRLDGYENSILRFRIEGMVGRIARLIRFRGEGWKLKGDLLEVELSKFVPWIGFRIENLEIAEGYVEIELTIERIANP